MQSTTGAVCTITFPVKYDGQLATCVERLKSHDSLEDQADTRAQWRGTVKLSPVELNPDRRSSSYLWSSTPTTSSSQR